MRLVQAFGVVLGGLVITAAFASPAQAGCATPLKGQPRIFPTSDRSDDPAPIVGLWQVTFISQGNNVPPANIPDNAVLDQGFAQWHSDGTEIMNSGRDPVTSSFCLGVWKSAGPRTFKLNHFAISWDDTGTFCTPAAPATNCMVGPANIREEVTVSLRGDSYRGWVTIDQYDTKQNVMAHLTGTVVAHRINP
jgi:hypothetical protein